jgi:exonuclease III
MNQTFRVITWNCRRASLKSGLWDYLLEIDPDVALLQDYGTIPERVMQVYVHAQNSASAETSRAPRFMTGILVKGNCTEEVPLPAPTEWVAQELEIFKEYFTARAVTLHNGVSLNVMSVYSLAIPIDRTRLVGINTTGIQLTQNREVWMTELLWATLGSMNIKAEEPFIVGADLNSSETLDDPRPRGNREIMDRMNALGFYDCLRMFKGKLTPTFRNPRGSVVHQLDHLYVTPSLLSKLTWSDVGATGRVFGSTPTLSDHLPIVADFVWPR